MQPARQSAFNKAKVKGRQLHCACIFFFFLRAQLGIFLHGTRRARTNKKIAANEQLEKSLVGSHFQTLFLASGGPFNLNWGLRGRGQTCHQLNRRPPKRSRLILFPANKCGNEWGPYTLAAGAHLALLTSPSDASRIHADVAEAACEFFRAATDGAGGTLFAQSPVPAGIRSARRLPSLAGRACKIETQSQTECTAITRGQGEVAASREVGLLLEFREQQASVSVWIRQQSATLAETWDINV